MRTGEEVGKQVSGSWRGWGRSSGRGRVKEKGQRKGKNQGKGSRGRWMSMGMG